MEVIRVLQAPAWEAFLRAQPWSPFLQSWTMGEVYRATGQEPMRLALRDDRGGVIGVCQAIVVPARRGRHLSVPYGPVLGLGLGVRSWGLGLRLLLEELKRVARERGCAFIRMSPFWTRSVHPERASPEVASESKGDLLQHLGFRLAPLHMLAEHVWLLDLRGQTEEDILRGMRATTRNLIRRAEKERVTVCVSDDPVRDLPLFLALHEETRMRHRFTPYTDAFFRAQVELFSREKQCTLYLASYQGEVIATSIHMLYGGETSYHHGASGGKHPKIPASYLLQWRAIQDALRRGDRVYNFWGISPEGVTKHPFAGVTTFKTGFGGELLELAPCMDLPLAKRYWVTFGIEQWRKWRRGF